MLRKIGATPKASSSYPFFWPRLFQSDKTVLFFSSPVRPDVMSGSDVFYIQLFFLARQVICLFFIYLCGPDFFCQKRPTRRDVWPSKRDGRNGLWCKTLCLLPGVESFFQRNVQVCLLQRGSVSVQVQVRFWLRVAIILRHSQNCK